MHQHTQFRSQLIKELLITGIPAFLFFSSMAVQADDVAAPTQKVGSHSTVSTENGGVRDDIFVDYICQKINENGGKVKDVKLMANSCFGGGLLDDLERAFGPGGACEGIPWVAGTASSPDESAWGWSDAVVDRFPAEVLGSKWTDGLAGLSSVNLNGGKGIIRDGSPTNNVLQDLQAARDNDPNGPNGSKKEAPQVASGNGGDQIMWKMDGAKHEAIVFGGNNNGKRHGNNIKNMKTALENTWSGQTNRIQTFDGGTREELFDAIDSATANLDENTQLVIYIDDHGGSTFDIGEAAMAIGDILIEDPASFNFEVPNGLFGGMYANYFEQPPTMPLPTLDLHIRDCMYCSSWNYTLNGFPLMFPGDDQTSLVSLEIPFYALRPGNNLLEIVPQMPPSVQSGGGKPQNHFGSLSLYRLEVSSGPIAEMTESALAPGQSAAFYDPNRNGEGIFVELLDDGVVVVYMFSYNREGTGQAWFVGVGVQTGEGIVVHDMLLPSGPMFGPGFDPADVKREFFGSLAFHFPTCGSSQTPGTLFLYPHGNFPYEGLINPNYVQLTTLVSCDTSIGSANSPLSGSWYDPAHDGEGIILEVLENGTAVVQWFTYDGDGNQMWIQGVGTFDGDTLTVENLYTGEGTSWGSGFNPDDITLPTWGNLTMKFTGCGIAEVIYDSTVGFGTGTLNMVRLTNLMGITCVE